MTYLLLYFKVHLEGLSKLAQAQALLQVNKRLLIHCMWESQQLSDSNQLQNFVFYMYLLILQGSQQWNILLLFLVPLTELKTESTWTLSDFNFQCQTKTLYQNNLKNITFFFYIFIGQRCNKSSVITPDPEPKMWVAKNWQIDKHFPQILLNNPCFKCLT